MLGDKISPISYKVAPLDSPIGKKTRKEVEASTILERRSPGKEKLQGKIGNIDAEVIEQAIDHFRNEVAVAKEERMKKEELLKSLSSGAKQSSPGRPSVNSQTLIGDVLITKKEEQNMGPGAYMDVDSFAFTRDSQSHNICVFLEKAKQCSKGFCPEKSTHSTSPYKKKIDKFPEDQNNTPGTAIDPIKQQNETPPRVFEEVVAQPQVSEEVGVQLQAHERIEAENTIAKIEESKYQQKEEVVEDHQEKSESFRDEEELFNHSGGIVNTITNLEEKPKEPLSENEEPSESDPDIAGELQNAVEGNDDSPVEDEDEEISAGDDEVNDVVKAAKAPK